MAFILIAITTILSAIALCLWVKLFRSRRKPAAPQDNLADIYIPDWPGLIALLLPRSLRAVWNALLTAAVPVFMGSPHFLVIWNFWNQSRLGPWLYLHYLWTLAWWLLLLAVPATVFVRRKNAHSPTH